MYVTLLALITYFRKENLAGKTYYENNDTESSVKVSTMFKEFPKPKVVLEYLQGFEDQLFPSSDQFLDFPSPSKCHSATLVQ